MKAWHFQGVLTDKGWVDDCTITLDENYIIQRIESDVTSVSEKSINAYLIPGFQNAHSHAFQYKMAGLAEGRYELNQHDDFWTWRNTMYQLANTMTPDDMYDIGYRLYTDMGLRGITHVAEFHYIHHNNDGTPYSNRAQMAIALMQAANDTKMQLTIVPIFYQQADFGIPIKAEQHRFHSASLDDYLLLHDATKSAAKEFKHVTVGVGIHSLRAVQPESILELLKSIPTSVPIHLHIAEQLLEVERSQAVLGTTPVQWLLDNCDVDERFNLVHATHMTIEETKRLAQSDARVVLCPTTEGNLGDGVFPLMEYMAYGGQWCIGSDSQVGLCPMEELRLLEYTQRLLTHKRNIMCQFAEGESGDYAWRQMYVNGAAAMGNFAPCLIDVGTPLRGCLIDSCSIDLSDLAKEKRLSALMYSLDSKSIIGTINEGY